MDRTTFVVQQLSPRARFCLQAFSVHPTDAGRGRDENVSCARAESNPPGREHKDLHFLDF